MDEEKKRGFFGGLGRVLSAPPRFIWDKLTVDDEERARNEERRRQRELDRQNERAVAGYGTGSRYEGREAEREGRDYHRESSKRYYLMKLMDQYGLKDLNEAALLAEDMRGRKQNTIALFDAMNRQRNSKEELRLKDLEILMEALGQRQRMASSYLESMGPQQNASLPSVQLPSRNPKRY